MLREARSPFSCFVVYWAAFPLFILSCCLIFFTFAYLNYFYYEKTFYYYLFGTCLP